jgi:AraC-like ligand binding domain
MPDTVRNYSLYGESEHLPDVMHCETIAERSVLHDWELAPHRHDRLHQLLLLRSGGGMTRLDDREFALWRGTLVNVPPGTVHAFTFEAGTQGLVVTLADAMLDELLGRDPEVRRVLGRSWMAEAGPAIDEVMAQLAQEYAARSPARALLLRGLGATLLGRAARVAAGHDPFAANMAGSHLLQRFETLPGPLARGGLRSRAGRDPHSPEPGGAGGDRRAGIGTDRRAPHSRSPKTTRLYPLERRVNRLYRGLRRSGPVQPRLHPGRRHLAAGVSAAARRARFALTRRRRNGTSQGRGRRLADHLDGPAPRPRVDAGLRPCAQGPGRWPLRAASTALDPASRRPGREAQRIVELTWLAGRLAAGLPDPGRRQARYRCRRSRRQPKPAPARVARPPMHSAPRVQVCPDRGSYQAGSGKALVHLISSMHTLERTAATPGSRISVSSRKRESAGRSRATTLRT